MSRGESRNRIDGRWIPEALMMAPLSVRARRVVLATMIVVVTGLTMLAGVSVLGAEADDSLIETAQIVQRELAAPDGEIQNCTACHNKVLRGHDQLGEGSEACRSCHGIEMGTLHLASGETMLPLSESVRLCSQCHQQRWGDWEDGTHGTPVPQVDKSEDGVAEKAGCISCHDPHQPQVVLTNMTRTHPAPAPPPPPPPSEVLAILGGIVLLLGIAAGAVIRTRGGRP